MVRLNCPFCHITVEPITARNREKSFAEGSCINEGVNHGDFCIWEMCICPSCDERILVKRTSTKITVYPQSQPQKLDENLPKIFVSDLTEADICFSIGAFRATMMLCRRIIYAIIKNQGCKDIKELREKGIITQHYEKLAYGTKLIGDFGTHDELTSEQAPEEEDAEAALEFTHAIIKVLYIEPIKVNRAIEKMKSKRQPQQEFSLDQK